MYIYACFLHEESGEIARFALQPAIMLAARHHACCHHAALLLSTLTISRHRQKQTLRKRVQERSPDRDSGEVQRRPFAEPRGLALAGWCPTTFLPSVSRVVSRAILPKKDMSLASRPQKKKHVNLWSSCSPRAAVSGHRPVTGPVTGRSLPALWLLRPVIVRSLGGGGGLRGGLRGGLWVPTESTRAPQLGLCDAGMALLTRARRRAFRGCAWCAIGACTQVREWASAAARVGYQQIGWGLQYQTLPWSRNLNLCGAGMLPAIRRALCEHPP